MTREEAKQIAENLGFSHIGFFDAAGLEYRTEVRDMCRADKCNKYNRTWTCPPACGTLEEIAARTKDYDWGILLQTTGEMEDQFDAETIMEAMELQAERFMQFCDLLLDRGEDCLPMGSGGCSLCKTCTWPDAPCRHPERVHPSMEAYGLLVNDTCKLADVPYYYGKNTITYTSCILFP